MRRIPASVLLLFFSYSLLAPLLFAEPELKIAACCRRDGKHHCAKMAKMAESEDSGVRITPASTCPLFQPGASAPASAHAAVPPPSHAIVAMLVSAAPPAQQAEVKRRVSEARAWRKRGPPTLLS